MQALLTSWLLTALLHSTLLGLAALVLVRFLADPGLRTCVLRIGLFGGLISAGFQVGFGDVSSLSVPLALSTSVAEFTPVQPGAQRPAGQPVSLDESSGVQGLSLAQATPIFRDRFAALASQWRGLLLGIWGFGAVIGLTHLFRQRQRLVRSLARRALGDAQATRLLRQLAGSEFKRSVRLSTSAHIASPIALSQVEICIPKEGWGSLATDERSSLLAHELGHIVHRDPTWFLAAQVVERVFFLQPLTRVLRRHLQREAEYLVDDWAAKRTGAPLALARCLASVAAWTGPQSTQLIPGMVQVRSSLVSRVERILGAHAAPPSPRRRGLFTLGSAFAFLAFACSAPHVDTEPEQAIRAEIVPLAPDALVVTIAPKGQIQLAAEAGARFLGNFDLDSDQGARDFRSALAQAAAEFPRGGMPENSAPNPMADLIADGRVRIRVEEEVAYKYVQRVMALCGSRDVLLWNVELSGTKPGAAVYPVPLPVDLHQVQEETEEDQSPPPSIDVRIRLSDSASSPGQVEYAIFTRADAFPSQIQEGTGHEIRELSVDSVAELQERLRYLYQFNQEVPLILDARPGVVYADVVAAIDAVILAGFTHITFVGEYAQ